MRINILAAVTAASLSLGFAGLANAADIDTTGAPSIGSISPFGSPDTATYGQTFVAGGSALNSFSLYLGQSTEDHLGSLDFIGYIGTWDGTKLGSILYTSDTQNKNTDDQIEYAFNTGNLAVTSGNTYVAFLSVSNLAAQSQALFVMPGVEDATPGGFVFMNNNTNFEELFINDWSSFG
eukprot:gene51921-69482_t